MFDRIRHILKKEFIQVFRDPKMIPIIFVTPMIQLLVFGYAATTDVKHITTAVYDLDNSVLSRELVARFSRSQYFDVVADARSERQVQRTLDTSQAQVVIRIASGFEQRLRHGQTADVQLLIDGSDSNVASIVLSYSARIGNEFSADLLHKRLGEMGVDAPRFGQVELESRAWFNENLESRSFYVPGVMAILVMITVLTLTSMAVVREKEIGTMEQILVTPIKPTELILGKTIPFVLIGFVDVLLVTVVGVFWFQVPVRGSILLLLASTGLYLMPIVGLGLLISTICTTQQQAMMSVFFFGFPAILLSGFMFPIANMPVVVQWLTVLDPLRYFLVIVRGIFLKGVGVEILWPHMLALLGLGIATLTIATRRFHKTLA